MSALLPRFLRRDRREIVLRTGGGPIPRPRHLAPQSTTLSAVNIRLDGTEYSQLVRGLEVDRQTELGWLSTGARDGFAPFRIFRHSGPSADTTSARLEP